MQLHRRRFLRLLAGVPGLPAVMRSARAQTYPSRPVRIMVGFAPAARPTSWRGSWANGYRSGSVNNSSSRTHRRRWQ